MFKFVLLILAAMTSFAHAESCLHGLSMDFAKKNLPEVMKLVALAPSHLSPQGQMMIALDAFKSGIPMSRYVEAESQIPVGLTGRLKTVIRLDSEERAVMATAAIQYNISVLEIFGRAELTSVDLSNKVRVLQAIHSVREGWSSATLVALSETVPLTDLPSFDDGNVDRMGVLDVSGLPRGTFTVPTSAGQDGI